MFILLIYIFCCRYLFLLAPLGLVEPVIGKQPADYEVETYGSGKILIKMFQNTSLLRAENNLSVQFISKILICGRSKINGFLDL